jgi:SYP7 family syntaxin
MSNSGDILLRGGALLKKYQHYLPDEEMAPIGPKGEKADQFSSLFYSLKHNLRDIVEKAESIKEETNRAALATANAEIRRSKNFLRGELPRLRKYAAKCGKKLSEKQRADREDEVNDFEYRIECIPDGVTRSLPPPPPRTRIGSDGASGSGGGGGNKKANARLAVDEESLKASLESAVDMNHTDESRAFRQEFEDNKRKQDKGLDDISKGLRVLRNLGGEMDDEVKRQAPVMDAIENKMDSTSGELRTANGKLKKVITQMRSTRHFCIDVILIFIVLGISLYLYNQFG